MTRVGVRRIIKGRRGNRGRISASKAGGRAAFESTLERDFFMLLEFDEEVLAFTPQPVSIPYLGKNGRRTSYVPDALVEYVDARPPCLYEVKYAAELLAKREEFRLKFQAAQRYAREQGWTFCTVTERAIRTVRIKNVTFLRAFLDPNRVFSGVHQDHLLARVRSQGETTPASLLADCTLEQRGTLLPVLWHLVATRQIGAALDVPLGMNSALFPGSDDD